METLAEIGAWSVLAFGALLGVCQLVVHEVGFRVGRRVSANVPPDGVGTVVGGILGLLAFVLALTLSFASTRFDERRSGTLAEANAIGTAWLRAQAIGHPRGLEIARLLETYIETRRDFVSAERKSAAIETLNERSNRLQSTLWGHAAAIVRERSDPVAVSLATSLNDAFDAATATRFAYDLRLPPQLFWMLIGMTMTGMVALGVQLGLRGRPLRPLVLLLVLMWTVVIVEILDLAAPRAGAWRTSTDVYDWTLQGFRGGISIPPAPPSR